MNAPPRRISPVVLLVLSALLTEGLDGPATPEPRRPEPEPDPEPPVLPPGFGPPRGRPAIRFIYHPHPDMRDAPKKHTLECACGAYADCNDRRYKNLSPAAFRLAAGFRKINDQDVCDKCRRRQAGGG